MKIPMPTGTPPKKHPVFIVRIVKYDGAGEPIPDSEEFWVCDGINTTLVLEKFSTLEEAVQYVENSKTLELISAP